MPALAPVTTATRPDRSKFGSTGLSPSVFHRHAPIEALARKIFRESIVRRTCVRFHALEPRDACGERREIAIGLARHALPGYGLQELVHRQPARVARRALGGQDVIRPRCLVAERNGRLLSEKQRAVAGESLEPPIEVARVYFEVLGRVAVGGEREILARLAEHHLAVVAPRGARGVARGRRQR